VLRKKTKAMSAGPSRRDLKQDVDTMLFLGVDVARLAKLMTPPVAKEPKEYLKLAEEKAKNSKNPNTNHTASTPRNPTQVDKHLEDTHPLDTTNHNSDHIEGHSKNSDLSIAADAKTPKDKTPQPRPEEKIMIDILTSNQDLFDELIESVIVIAEARNPMIVPLNRLMVSWEIAATREGSGRYPRLTDEDLDKLSVAISKAGTGGGIAEAKQGKIVVSSNVGTRGTKGAGTNKKT